MSKKKRSIRLRDGQPARESAPADARAPFWTEEAILLRELWAELRPEKWIILALLVAAGALRFFNLTQADLWMDEITILKEAYTGEFHVVSFKAHSVHLIPVGFFLRLFGQNEFGLRFWSATLGTLAIPLIFVWMQWTAGSVAARIAALLACVNCFLVYYSQDGNYYGGMTFYTAAMLCGFAMFFRGAPYAGVAIALIFGVLNYKNHPVAAIPVSVMLFVMALGSIATPRMRKSIYAIKPAEWFGRPAIPLLCVAGVIGAFIAAGAWANLTKSFLLLAEPGEGTLKNVTFGSDLFREHLAQFLVNFYRPRELFGSENAEFYMAIPMAILALLGMGIVVFKSFARKSQEMLPLAVLFVACCAASYYMLFSIQMSRNFYVRYFTYLIPLLLAMISYGLASIHELLTRNHCANRVIALPVILIAGIAACYSVRYLLDDKSNFKEGITILKEKYKPGDKFLLLTRQDRIAAGYYFAKAGLPTQSPVYTINQQPEFADAAAGAFPYVINGMKNTWIISGWRFVQAPSLYDYVLTNTTGVFHGTSKLGSESDVWLHYIRGDERYAYSNAAVIFPKDNNGMIRTRIGKWNITGFDGKTFVIDVMHELKDVANPAGKWIPILPDRMGLQAFGAENWPENQDISGDHTLLHNDRDGSYDFIFYQPEGAPRQVQVNLAPRLESDPILSGNSSPIPPGMLLGVAVDGVHRGFWNIPSGKVTEEAIVTPDVTMPPGSHRITISGLQPRAKYTPYFSWILREIEWLKTSPVIPQKSLEEEGKIQLSPGWPALLQTGTPGQMPSDEWTIKGPQETIVDPELKCVAGDSPIRISFPPKSEENYALLTPPMPVKPGTLAVYTMYLKLEGLDDNEVTPIHVFKDANGDRIPGIQHANGSNLRGTTLGVKGWVRRQITVPVPENAAVMFGGFAVYPVPHGNTTGGKLWVGSVFSPGAGDLKLKDPILPDNYFNVSESTPLPADDEPAK